MNVNKIIKGVAIGTGAITTVAAGRIENRYLSLGVALIGNLMITYGVIKDTKEAK
jgi:hypothetical protein